MPIKRGTGCSSRGDELQSLGSFMSNLVTYIYDANEEHESKLRWAAILFQTKQNGTLYKMPICSCHTSASPWALANKGVEKWDDVVSDIMIQGRMGTTPLYQQIETQHESIARHLDSGKPIEVYEIPWNKTSFDDIWVPRLIRIANVGSNRP